MIRQILHPVDRQPFWIPEHLNLVTEQLIEGRCWEPALLPIFDYCCRPVELTVEVGAYLGDHTVLLAAKGPTVAFEPQLLPHALLCLNLALRGFTTTAFRVPLYSRNVSLVKVEDPSYDGGSHPSLAWIPAPPTEGTVQATTFDQFGLGPIDLIKVDAQGCDLPVLQGMQQTIQRDHPVILAEYEPDLVGPHGGYSGEDFLQWIRAQGYHRPLGFEGRNLLAVPAARDLAPYAALLTDQGLTLT